MYFPSVCAVLASVSIDNHHTVVKNVVDTRFDMYVFVGPASISCTYWESSAIKICILFFWVYFMADCCVRSFELTVLLKGFN